jgi:TolB-like protein/Tfp pilus assembly protein PilF
MALPLPDKPSIAVLPFANMSDEPGQEHLSDGITDDLITALSQVSGLFVISRNSTFLFKGRAVSIKQVSEELGVRYVLEGSVQRAGDRLRINAQLIDALAGGHVWADRYDGSLTDVFALQDRVTRSIAEALSVRLTSAEQQAIGQQETAIPQAYEEFLRGWLHVRRDTPEDYRQGIAHLKTAAALDPGYGRAYAALAWAYSEIYRRNWNFSLGMSIYQAHREARRYLAEARKHPTNLYLQAEGLAAWVDGGLSDSLAKLKEAVAADPGDALSYVYLGATLISLGRPAEAAQYIQTAMRLEPHHPAVFTYFLALAQFDQRQYPQAAETFEMATRLNPEDETSFAALGATYGILGRKEDAEAAIDRCNELRVKRGGAPITILTMPWFAIGSPSLGIKRESLKDIERGLRLAGVPTYLSDGLFGERNKLSADEIRVQLVGHRLHGRSIVTTEERAAAVTADGMAEISGDWVSSGPYSGGRVEIADGQLCYKFGLVSYCGTVLRNPGGTRELENEFIWDAGSPFTFSRVD